MLRPGGRLVAATNSLDHLGELWRLVGRDRRAGAGPLLRRDGRGGAPAATSRASSGATSRVVSSSGHRRSPRYIEASVAHAKHLADRTLAQHGVRRRAFVSTTAARGTRLPTGWRPRGPQNEVMRSLDTLLAAARTSESEGRLEDAALSYREAIALAPDDAELGKALVRILEQRGDARAVVDFLTTSAAARGDASLQKKLGDALDLARTP